ncbi:hypothetical protein FOZ62_016843, partial [Perkinsus olseni]
MPEEVRKDLRASHFEIGRGTAKPEDWQTMQTMAMVAHPIQSNELDKALKADLRASHFSIGAPEKTAEARTITQTAYVWPDLNLAPAAVKGV